MGYMVAVDDDAATLLGHLKSAPDEIFGRPYAGYMLFLVGAADVEALDWLRGNAVSLDSLTGDHVAFAIFARRFDIKIRTNGSKSKRNRHLGEVPLDKVHSRDAVSRLVKSGRLGWVEDGDWLTAMTYGVDDIARSLGVLDSLPCLVLIDAIPEGQISVVPLDQANFSRLFAVMRKVIHNLIEEPGFRAYISAIEEIACVDGAMSPLEAQLNELELRQSRVPEPESLEKNIISAYEQATIAIAKGATRQFMKIIRTLSVYPEEQRLVHEEASRLQKELIRTDRTIRTLTHYLTEFSWPLAGEARDRYIEVFEQYVVRLFEDRQMSLDSESPSQCEVLRQELQARRQVMVHDILSLLPSTEVAIQRALTVKKNRRAALDRQAAELRTTILALRKQRALAVRACLSAEHPSLASLFASISKRKKLVMTRRSIRATAGEFTRSMLSPETLLEIAKTVGDL
jgi:hypothetical protein